MQIKDLIGNPLEVGDLVSIKTDLVVGQIVKIENGEIARGVSLAGDKPHGELAPPMIVIGIQMTKASMPLPNGQCQDVLKVVKPTKENPVIDNG